MTSFSQTKYARKVKRLAPTAFTIVELLVVIAIIGLLVAITIPAVNSMRASARRSQCMNNMRQVTMAVITYEASNQRFPPASKYVGDDPEDPDDDEGIGHSMYTYLLPNFEEKAVYDQIQFNLDWRDNETPNDKGKTNYDLTHTIHFGGVIQCPAAPTFRRQKFTSGTINEESDIENQVADYAASWYLDARSTQSQLSTVTKRLIDNDVLSVVPLWDLVPDPILKRVRGEPSVSSRHATQNQRWWGVMRRQYGEDPVVVRAANVRDGLSSTFLLFEAAGRPDHYAAGRRVPGDIMGTATQGMRWGSPDLAIKINEACKGEQLINCHNWDEVYAFHRGGSMVSYVDGSVEFMRQEMDPEVFVSLYTMAGGDVVSDSKR